MQKRFLGKYFSPKIIYGILILAVCLTACGSRETKETADPLQENSEKQSGGNAGFSGNAETDSGKIGNSNTEDGSIILTDEDIYIFSYECGYFSWAQKPGRNPLLIENEEQLAFARVRYGLDYPGDYNEEDYWFYDPSLIDFFNDMESRYPLEEYVYLIQYEEVSSGGYYLHADKVVIYDDCIGFALDDDSYTPADSDEMSFADVMGGFMHMAAIPKEYTEGMTFVNVVYPDQNDPLQRRDR